MTESIETVALFEEVAERLRQRIYAHQLQPGAWIDEEALCKEYGISRTPLREALKVLHTEGLVRLVPRKGCQVTRLSAEDLNKLFPVMALLEGRCAYEAALNLDQDGLEQLEDLHAKLERHFAARDMERYYAVNYQFHVAVQDLSGNPWLQRSTSELRRFLKLARGRQLTVPGRLESSFSEHRHLMEALRARDADRAGRIMHDHLISQGQAWKKLQEIETAESASASAA